MSSICSRSFVHSVRRLLYFALPAVSLFASQPLRAQEDVAHFDLFPNPKVLSCLVKPGAAEPKAHVTVVRGKLNDTLILNAEDIKPGLAFDLFTVQRSNQLANGDPVPGFTNFGFAWYQSDLEANEAGKIHAVIKTILLDQIFGFDPDLSPNTFNTFNVGFWFNNPNDANVDGCVFDVTHPTPFNGEHRAGPLAMISRPNPDTGLGPLCTNPDTSTSPATCNP